MASVFPDTSVNNPDTGFAWADGDIWNDPDSGLTYSWYNPVWKTGGAGAEGNFVQIDGDNMTGDLTLGTDKITLDATAGAAVFAGQVDAHGGLADGNAGVQLGQGYIAARSTRSDAAQPILDLLNSSGTVVHAVAADGTGTFTGPVYDAGWASSTDRDGYYVGHGGIYVAKQSGLASGVAFGVYSGAQTSTSGDNRTVTIAGSGAATFAGDIQTGDSNNQGRYTAYSPTADSADDAFNVFRGSTALSSRTVSVSYDGSASFAGGIVGKGAGPAYAFEVTDGTTNMGGLYRDANGANLYLKNSAGVNNISLLSNGAASFASGAVNVSLASNEGRLNVRRTAAGKAFSVLNSSTSTESVTFLGDGSASFLNRVYVTRATNTSCFQAYTANDAQAKIDLNSNGNATFQGTVTADNVTFNLEADDDTKYTSTTDSEGNETRVYNGAVLDVKDRIQNVLARMDAIEANEITDDATDSALLTLIANLSARLDERDTAIAALTTRIETLES